MLRDGPAKARSQGARDGLAVKAEGSNLANAFGVEQVGAPSPFRKRVCSGGTHQQPQHRDDQRDYAQPVPTYRSEFFPARPVGTAVGQQEPAFAEQNSICAGRASRSRARLEWRCACERLAGRRSRLISHRRAIRGATGRSSPIRQGTRSSAQQAADCSRCRAGLSLARCSQATGRRATADALPHEPYANEQLGEEY